MKSYSKHGGSILPRTSCNYFHSKVFPEHFKLLCDFFRQLIYSLLIYLVYLPSLIVYDVRSDVILINQKPKKQKRSNLTFTFFFRKGNKEEYFEQGVKFVTYKCWIGTFIWKYFLLKHALNINDRKTVLNKPYELKVQRRQGNVHNMLSYF